MVLGSVRTCGLVVVVWTSGLKKLVGFRVLGPIRSWDAESLV